jgi:hypothetical protein
MGSMDCRKKHAGIVVPDITAWTEALWLFGIWAVMAAHRIPILWLFGQRSANVEFDLHSISSQKIAFPGAILTVNPSSTNWVVARRP